MSRAEQLASDSSDYLLGSMTPKGAYSSKVDAPGGQLEGTLADRSARVIRIDRIIRDENQPREDFDETALEQLTHSVKTLGLQLPIKVRWSPQRDRWIIIDGERRWRAHQRAGIESISCSIENEELAEDEVLERQLATNRIRQSLNPIELAKSYSRLLTKRNWKPGNLADRIKVHRTTIIRTLDLLKLPKDVQDKIISGEIPASAARSLTKAETEEELRILLQQFTDGQITTHEAADKVRKRSKSKPSSPKVHKLKQFTSSSGIQLVASAKRRESLAAVLEAAEELVTTLKADGRIRPAA